MTPLMTSRLNLVLNSPEQLRAMIDSLPPDQKVEMSSDWLAKVQASTTSDPWLHGFTVHLHDGNTPVGNAGFKAPPCSDGIVEIAYGVEPEHQGKGYATEAAQALVTFAFSHPEVRLVCAHTLPEENASTKVLAKCAFKKVGEVVDPEDGPVWRWEKSNT